MAEDALREIQAVLGWKLMSVKLTLSLATKGCLDDRYQLVIGRRHCSRPLLKTNAPKRMTARELSDSSTSPLLKASNKRNDSLRTWSFLCHPKAHITTVHESSEVLLLEPMDS
jgi:hypothetical protein